MKIYLKRSFLPIIVFMVFIISSCSPKQEISSKKNPKGIIQPDTMVVILTDLQLAEAKLHILERDGKLTDSLTNEIFRTIFIKHNITKIELQKSTAFYEENLGVYEEIYSKVITRLSQLQTELTNTK